MQKKKRKYSQIFLKDNNLSRKIVAVLNPAENDIVLEIGPGRGALTQYLLERNVNVIAIEIDETLIDYLKNKFDDHKKLSLLKDDILKIKVSEILQVSRKNRAFYCAGNLPYDVGTAIISKLTIDRMLFKKMVFMLQKELTDRMLSTPGSRQYGYLSVFIKYFYHIRKIMNVSPKSFTPAPAVNSTVIELIPKHTGDTREYEISFIDFIKKCFAYKRKTILNNLLIASNGKIERNILIKILNSINIPENTRAEMLDIEELKKLHDLLKSDIK